MKFKDRFIRQLKTKKTRYEVFEENAHGLGTLGLRVSPSGRRTWIYLYKYRGRARRISLGHYPLVGIAEAHKAAGNVMEQISHGVDPGEKIVLSRQNMRKSPTFAQIADEYIEKWAKPRKKSWQEDLRILKKNILPKLHHRTARAITKKEVIALVDVVLKKRCQIFRCRS